MTESMFRRFAACGLVALGLAAAQPAIAQEAAATPDPAPVAPALVAARYAACLVAERPDAADAFLAASPGTALRNQAFETLAPIDDQSCTSFATGSDGMRLQIPEVILTGYIAEARYVVGFPGGPPAEIASAVAETMTDETYSARLAAAADPQAEFPRIFGDCIVGLRARQVDRLIRARPGSSEETLIIAALQPSLGQCLWNGQTLQFSREMLRAALADGLYRKAAGISLTVEADGVGR